MRVVTINIEPLVPIDKLDPEDAELSKAYMVSLDDSVTQEQIADAALDVFHDNIAINELENFELTVLFNGETLEPDPEHDSYSLSGSGKIVNAFTL